MCQSTGRGCFSLRICVILLYLGSFLHILPFLSTSELHQALTWLAFQSRDRPILQCDIMENSIPQGSTWLKQALMLIGGARRLRWPFRAEHCVYECVPVCMCVYLEQERREYLIDGVLLWGKTRCQAGSGPVVYIHPESKRNNLTGIRHQDVQLSLMTMAVYWVTAGLPINLIKPWFRTTCVLFQLNELKGTRCYQFPTHR